MGDKYIRRRTFQADLKLGFRMPFLFAIAGVILCLCFDSFGTLKLVIRNPLIYVEGSVICVQYFYFNAVSFGGVFSSYFVAILTALPFAASYSLECNHHLVPYKLVRSGRENYCISKIATAALTGGITFSLGSALFMLALSVYMPIVTPAKISEMAGLPYHSALATGSGLFYLLIALYLAFLAGALWSSVGICISAYIPNPYIAICSPMLFQYALVEIGRLFHLPRGFRLDMLLCARGTIISDSVTLIVTTAAVSMSIFLCYKIFSARSERRLEHAE